MISPLDGGKTGANPTDRVEPGTKGHAVTEGDGVPIVLWGPRANEHDKYGVALADAVEAQAAHRALPGSNRA